MGEETRAVEREKEIPPQQPLSGSGVLAALALLLCLPDALFRPIGAGLDASWAIALQLAVQCGAIFGREVFFTFGPLGVLATRLPIGGNLKPLFVAFDLFFLLNLFAALKLLFALCRGRGAQLVVLLGVALHSVVLFRFDPAFFPLLFAVLWAIQFGERGALVACLSAVVWATVAIFLKPHIGVLAWAIVMFLGVCSSRVKVLDRVVMVLLLVSVPCAAALLLRVDLRGYLMTSLQLAAGYPDAMWSAPREFHREFLFAGCCVLASLFGLLLSAVEERRGWTFFLRHLLLVGIFFVLWRQGSVRADGHVRMISNLLLPMAGFSYLLLGPARWGIRLNVLLAFGAQFAFGRECLMPERWQARVEGPVGYVDELLDREVPEPPTIPVEAQLSPELVERIAGFSVDILPWELSSVYYYRLRYAPRGILQSYAAYEPLLDRLGAVNLETDRAPRFLLVHPGQIDKRSALADEPETKRRILMHYQPVMRDAGHVLLERTDSTRAIVVKHLASGTARLGESIPIPEHVGAVVLTAGVEYSSHGRLWRELVRPPELHFVLAGETGREARFRAVVPQLQAGVIISPLMHGKEREVDSLMDFYCGRFSEMPTVKNVQVDSRSVGGFAEQFSYSLESWEMSSVPAACLGTDNAQLAEPASAPESDPESEQGAAPLPTTDRAEAPK